MKKSVRNLKHVDAILRGIENISVNSFRISHFLKFSLHCICDCLPIRKLFHLIDVEDFYRVLLGCKTYEI